VSGCVRSQVEGISTNKARAIILYAEQATFQTFNGRFARELWIGASCAANQFVLQALLLPYSILYDFTIFHIV